MRRRLMRVTAAVLAALFLPILSLPMVSTGAQAQERAGVPLPWVSLESLPPEERSLARQVASESLHDERGRPDRRWKEVKGATVPTVGGELFFVSAPPANYSCGNIALTIFGPVSDDGTRPVLLAECLNDIALLPRAGQMPDLLSPVSDLTGLVWHWDGDGWGSVEEVESLRPSERTRAFSGTKFGYLIPLVGTYNLVAILQDPYVSAILRSRMKEHFLTLLKNLGRHEPIAYHFGCVIVRGHAPHLELEEKAILAICMDHAIYAALFTEGEKLLLFSTDWHFEFLPEPIRAFLHRIDVPKVSPAANFEWFK